MYPAPYTGDAGVTSRFEAEQLLAAMPSDPPRKLMLGVLTTSRILAGQGITNPKRYPLKNKIAAVFPDDARAVSLVHVAWSPQEAYGSCYEQLARAREAGGDRCHGLQVNGAVLPLPGDLKAYAAAFPGDRLVLQYRDLAKTPAQIFSHLLLFAWSLTDVLLDGSAGTGALGDRLRLAEIAATLRLTFPHLGVGVAGGLCAETIDEGLQTLLTHVPRLSLDAESRLRSADDHLDLAAANHYLRVVEGVLSYA